MINLIKTTSKSGKVLYFNPEAVEDLFTDSDRNGTIYFSSGKYHYLDKDVDIDELAKEIVNTSNGQVSYSEDIVEQEVSNRINDLLSQSKEAIAKIRKSAKNNI